MALAAALTRSRNTIIFAARINVFKSLARAESMISANEIQTKSPYDELKVNIDFESTRDNPMKVNAYGDERTIACVCDDMHFMTLKKGPPVKCKCGYWFQLVDANKFWIKEQDS